MTVGWIVALVLALASCTPGGDDSAASATKAGNVPLSCDVFMFRGCPFVACVRGDVPSSLAISRFHDCVPGAAE